MSTKEDEALSSSLQNLPYQGKIFNLFEENSAILLQDVSVNYLRSLLVLLLMPPSNFILF